MLTNQPSDSSFDFEHLKRVVADLKQANKVLDTKAKEEKEKQEKKEKEAILQAGVSSFSPSSFSPQMERDKFANAVVRTPLFKDLQQEFFKIVPNMGQEVLMVCQDAYNKGTLTEEQREELATIGNMLTTEIPFEMLRNMPKREEFASEVEGKAVTEGFGNFISTLKKTHKFFTDNQSVAVDIGEKILSVFKPLKNFVESTADVVKEADVSDPIKLGFNKGLNNIKTQSKKISDTILSAIKNHIPAPNIDLTKLPIVSPLIKKLQENLLPLIFPIGGAILNAGFSLFNSGILKPEQKDELVGIGKDIMSLPHKLITGKIDFMGVLTGLSSGLKSLGSFFFKNPDIMLRAGATILPAMLPCGGFLANALSSDLVQDTMGSVVKKGLGLLSGQFEGVEKMLEDKAQHVLKAPQRE